MQPVDSTDTKAIQKIENMNKEMEALLNSAHLMEASHQYLKAVVFYEQAQALCLYSGRGPKAIILNEIHDEDNWRKINKKIEAIKK